MNIQVLWHGLFDGVEEFSELRSAMARKAASDHFSGGDIEGRKKRGRAVTHIVMGMPLHLPRTHGQKRLCAVERLDLALLVDTQYDRSLGRIEVKPDDITHFSTNSGSVESLNVSVRWGCRPNAFQMRCIVEGASPTVLAIARKLQCVASAALASRARRLV